MRKSLLIAISVIVAALAIGVVAVVFRAGHSAKAPQDPADNLAVTIDGQSFTLVDGVAEHAAAPGTATRNTLRVVGDLVSGDVTGDGKPEAALLLSNDPGGSGTFYYAVLAIDDGGTWKATNALPLGDRIKPEGIEFKDNRFVYRFLERTPGQPMADAPTIEKLVPIRFNAATQQISEGL